MSGSENVKPPFCPPDVEWRKGSLDNLPDGAINCGKFEGEDVYTGRGYHEGELLIGSVVKGKQCVVTRGESSHEIMDFQVMCVPVGGPLAWEPVIPDSEFPEDTIFAGKLKDGQKLMIGRIVEGENTSIGWVDENKQLHVFKDGKEDILTEFEVVKHKYLKFLCICPPCPPRRFNREEEEPVE